MTVLLVFIFLLLMLLVLAAKSLVVAKESERLVVLRLGKLLGVYGPGLSMVVPFVDHAIRVKVDGIAGWQGLSESELQRRAAEIAMRGN